MSKLIYKKIFVEKIKRFIRKIINNGKRIIFNNSVILYHIMNHGLHNQRLNFNFLAKIEAIFMVLILEYTY